MTKPLKLAVLAALATAALFSFTSTAGATPTVLDNSCSASGDICTSILLSKKSKQVKFEIISATAAVQGEYELCVKGPHGKECKDFVLEQLPDEEIWADKVNWQKNFNDDVGSYIVKWKYMGDRISEKLRFDVGQQGEA
jgi:hypothetical protein